MTFFYAKRRTKRGREREKRKKYNVSGLFLQTLIWYVLSKSHGKFLHSEHVKAKPWQNFSFKRFAKKNKSFFFSSLLFFVLFRGYSCVEVIYDGKTYINSVQYITFSFRQCKLIASKIIKHGMIILSSFLPH